MESRNSGTAKVLGMDFSLFSLTAAAWGEALISQTADKTGCSPGAAEIKRFQHFVPHFVAQPCVVGSVSQCLGQASHHPGL